MDSSHKAITLPRALTGIRVRGDAAEESRRRDEMDEARRRGYESAVEELRQETDERRLTLAKLQDETLRKLAEQEQKLVEDLHQALPDLVVEGVRRVLPEVNLEADTVQRIVRGVLENQVADREGLTVILSPPDRELMESLRSELGLHYPDIELLADESFRSGDCMVRSRFGLTDARIDTKLKNLREALS